MPSFFAAIVAVTVIAAAAHFGLDALDKTSANAYASDSVRLD
jgi:hypothetical protein